jgi:hypothetical protein
VDPISDEESLPLKRCSEVRRCLLSCKDVRFLIMIQDKWQRTYCEAQKKSVDGANEFCFIWYLLNDLMAAADIAAAYKLESGHNRADL